MKKMKMFMLLITITLFFTACSYPVTKVTVQSFEIKKQGLNQDEALTKLTGIFVNRGFDIKMSNKDAGIVTTEYKKFASIGSEPPFDYYLQIRGKVINKGGNIIIQLNPIVKEQNRMNAAAYSEHELTYLTGDPKNLQFAKSMKPDTGWRLLGQTLFMNIVTDSAEALGISVDEVVQNVSKTASDAFSE